MNWYLSTANFFDWLIRLRSKWDWKKMRLKYKLDRVFGNVQLRQVVLAKYGWMTPFRLDSWINQNRLKHTDGVNKLRWMLLSKSHSFQGRYFIEPHFYLKMTYTHIPCVMIEWACTELLCRLSVTVWKWQRKWPLSADCLSKTFTWK